jgi:Potential Queuosine, Q, salvage protein family
MALTDEVRRRCAEVAEAARHVRIDLDAAEAIEPGAPPALDPERHYLEGSGEDVVAYLLTLDAINFGSGWFPTLRKRPGCSGYYTVAWALADRFRAEGPWTATELRDLDARTVATVLGQDPGHELMSLYAEALRQLGGFLGGRTPLDVVRSAGGSAERLAERLASGMPFFDDRGFWKRAQITANDLSLAGVAEFADLDRLTIFADNLVPHVLRVDGVLVYEEALAARIDAEELLPPGEEEREIRACAVHACERIAAGLGVPPRTLDVWLWDRGQGPRYKALPRHRTRTVYY